MTSTRSTESGVRNIHFFPCRPVFSSHFSPFLVYPDLSCDNEYQSASKACPPHFQARSCAFFQSFHQWLPQRFEDSASNSQHTLTQCPCTNQKCQKIPAASQQIRASRHRCPRATSHPVPNPTLRLYRVCDLAHHYGIRSMAERKERYLRIPSRRRRPATPSSTLYTYLTGSRNGVQVFHASYQEGSRGGHGSIQ